MKTALMALVLFMLAPAGPAPVASTAEEPPFVLGILRRDGVVLPFASFTGKDWKVTWPDTLRWRELPLLLSDVPSGWWGDAGAQTALTLWSDGMARGTVHLDKPVMVTPACERRIGLTTDYHPPEMPPPPTVRPYPKDGLVTSGAQPITAIERVPPGTREFTDVALAVIDPVGKAEQAAIDQFSSWDHPLSRKERAKIPVELEALYRAPMDADGWTAFHFEAIKRYAPGKDDDGCGLVTSASGWMGKGPDGKATFELTARVTYCDRRGVAYFLPLGLMHLRDRTYWIFQVSGYEIERYAVARPTPKRVEFEADYAAGSCGGF